MKCSHFCCKASSSRSGKRVDKEPFTIFLVCKVVPKAWVSPGLPGHLFSGLSYLVYRQHSLTQTHPFSKWEQCILKCLVAQRVYLPTLNFMKVSIQSSLGYTEFSFWAGLYSPLIYFVKVTVILQAHLLSCIIDSKKGCISGSVICCMVTRSLKISFNQS
jgi:hypothetical protein